MLGIVSVKHQGEAIIDKAARNLREEMEMGFLKKLLRNIIAFFTTAILFCIIIGFIIFVIVLALSIMAAMILVPLSIVVWLGKFLWLALL